MNIIDLRKKLLQSSNHLRICDDRRKISYQFGSAEWLAYLKNNALECPAEDRRKMIRRKEDREAFVETEVADSETNDRRIFLTPGEKRLLQDIYLSDFDDSSDLCDE